MPASLIKKPTSDRELKEYQEKVCYLCKNQFPLYRGIFTQGCKVVDLHGIANYEYMIREGGECTFFSGKEEK